MDLVYKKDYETDPLIKVKGLDDARFADQPKRKSSYGFSVSVNGKDITWKSRTTPNVATSSTHAEYVALAELLKELLHVMYLIEDMGFRVSKPMLLLTDSNGAIGVAKFERVNNRTKHIDVRYHFCREYVKNKTVELVKVKSEDNVADMFTKNLGKTVLSRLLEKMSLRRRV